MNPAKDNRYTIVLDERPREEKNAFSDTLLPFGRMAGTDCCNRTGNIRSQSVNDIPERIARMIRMYQYSGGSLSDRNGNFYRQGMYMKDYEDNVPWQGEYRRYFTTYHDLNIRQLRGYFTWRTYARRGDYRPIATSLAYMYLYELMCGIGTDAPEDTLARMDAFEAGFLDSGIGDPDMRRNLHRWKFEYAVIHNLPYETVIRYADQEMLRKDRALAALKNPMQHTDEEVFNAICMYYGQKLTKSPVITDQRSKGEHLFASVWRHVSERFYENGRDFFTMCFGDRGSRAWHPLSNAVYYEEREQEDAEYILNECRSYSFTQGAWQINRYEPLYFNIDRFSDLIHAADRLIRRAYKTGHYLKAKKSEAWAEHFVEAVIREEKKLEEESRRPKISIDLSGLEMIRADALITKDILLTEEEKSEELQLTYSRRQEMEDNGKEEAAADDENNQIMVCGLDTVHVRILYALLTEGSAEDIMKEEHLMPSVVADTINMALFDDTGDSVLECDGSSISIIEDYREDIEVILGGGIR